MNDLTIICDEVINSYDEEIKTIPTSFDDYKVNFKTQKFYVLLSVLLITIALLIAVSI